MKNKTCFFIGHRDTPENIYPALVEAVERHIVSYGITSFIVGRYGNFDRLAARAVREMKRKYPQIRLTMLLAYHPTEKSVDLCGFDDSLYPEGMEKVPYRAAIVTANRYAVKNSACLIAYAWQSGSNASRLLEYAVKNGVSAENLWHDRQFLL